LAPEEIDGQDSFARPRMPADDGRLTGLEILLQDVEQPYAGGRDIGFSTLKNRSRDQGIKSISLYPVFPSLTAPTSKANPQSQAISCG